MFGKRSDGRKLKTISPFLRMIPFIMNRRTDSMNTMTIRVALDAMKSFIKTCRDQGISMSYMTIIIAAYARTVAQHPVLNRYVANKRIYARNQLCVSFVALREYEEQGAAETTIKVTLDRADDIYTVAEKINLAIAENRVDDAENDADKLVNSIMKLPLIPSFIVNVLKFMEKHGMLPRSVIDLSPFHTSLFLTNMASIRMPAIHHHLYEFGTTTLFLAMGLPEVSIEDEKKTQVMPIGIVVDERICEGAVYAKAFKTLLRYMSNPSLLEKSAEVIIEDVD